MLTPQKHPDPFSGNNRKGETKKAKPTYIERILQGNDIVVRIEDCITNVVKGILAGKTTHVRNANSWNAYSDLNPAIREALLEFGFQAYSPGNQARLFSSSHFFAPVQLRFARGRMLPGEGCVIFNSRKGAETHEGIRQNYQHFRTQISLPFMSDKLLVPRTKDPESVGDLSIRQRVFERLARRRYGKTERHAHVLR